MCTKASTAKIRKTYEFVNVKRAKRTCDDAFGERTISALRRHRVWGDPTEVIPRIHAKRAAQSSSSVAIDPGAAFYQQHR